MKRFKTKKRVFIIKSKIIIYICIILFAAIYSFKYMKTIHFAHNNEEFVKYLLEDANHFKNYNSHLKKLIYKANRFLVGFNVNDPVSLLENEFFYKKKKEAVEQITYKEKNNEEKKERKPTIYIYSTHQTESYEAGNLKEFGITPDVMMASYLLEDRLQKEGINVIIEERKMSDYLKAYNLTYDLSYYASRAYAQDILSKNEVDLVMDLHRDALAKDLSTITLNQKNYAKILFVVGGKSSYVNENNAIVTGLHNKIKSTYPGLSRGILKRDASVYNQDLTNHSILLELGGNENTVDEVMNTVEAITPFLAEYIKEAYGNKNQTENIK